MRQTPVEQAVEEIIAPTLREMGFFVVRVRMMGTDNGQTLQIMADPLDESKELTIEDCSQISHAISALLEVDDPVKSAYRLEVSSPGIDRPLVQMNDFEKYIGFEAKLETSWPVEGRKRYRGFLRGVEGENILVEVDKMLCKLPFDALAQAKLVLTDELIKFHTDRINQNKQAINQSVNQANL